MVFDLEYDNEHILQWTNKNMIAWDWALSSMGVQSSSSRSKLSYSMHFAYSTFHCSTLFLILIRSIMQCSFGCSLSLPPLLFSAPSDHRWPLRPCLWRGGAANNTTSKRHQHLKLVFFFFLYDLLVGNQLPGLRTLRLPLLMRELFVLYGDVSARR